jgi:exodeoxyribonuclease-1
VSFVLYDIETTGVRKRYDQILQFAAIRTDFELQEVEAFESCSRLMPHVVPSPQALNVNGLNIESITDVRRPSYYGMICSIREKLESWMPSTFLGFNSIGFDEECLRHAFYQCLFPPYLTNTPPNTRGDVLHLMRAMAAFHPDDVVVPMTDAGKRTFALRPLALANGYPDFSAHDAMADVRALLYLCQIVAERAPDLWSRYQQFSQKRAVIDFIRDEPVFLYLDGKWSSQTHCVTSIGQNPDQANIQYCLSLAVDIDAIAKLDSNGLAGFLSQNDGAVLRVKANAAPVLCPIEDAPSRLLSDQIKESYLAVAEKIRGSADLVARLCAACVANEKVFPPAKHVESQLYEQPFWPGRDGDKLSMFHHAPWEERRSIIDAFSDRRSRQLARRLMFTERPDLMLDGERESLTRGMYSRISATDHEVPWLTITAAQRETDALLAEATGDARDRLVGYHEYLRKLAAPARP